MKAVASHTPVRTTVSKGPAPVPKLVTATLAATPAATAAATAAAAAASRADGYSITAVERALDVLESFRTHGGELTLVEVSRATGLHKPTAFRVLATLRRRGMVIKNDQTGVYRLGYAVLALAESAKSVGGLLIEARPAMRALRATLRHTVYLSVREDDQRVDVEQVEGLGEVRRVITLGIPHPLHVGAPSKVLMAGLPDDQIKALLDRSAPPGFDRDEFRREIAAVRRNGYARSSRSAQNATAISAPIRGSGGEVIAVLTVSVPITLFAEIRQDVIAGVMATAAAIWDSLKGTPAAETRYARR
jgi:DNA-binding IclR family transcriptional regulator